MLQFSVLNNYYHGFNRHNDEKYGESTYKEKKKNKREYYNK